MHPICSRRLVWVRISEEMLDLILCHYWLFFSSLNLVFRHKDLGYCVSEDLNTKEALSHLSLLLNLHVFLILL